jgi:hypothetical protein
MSSTAPKIRVALTCGSPHCACARPRGPWHCPTHEDHRPSFSVDERGGRVLVICRAGCTQAEVIGALTARGLWSNGTRIATSWRLASPLESAFRDFLAQRWNDVSVLRNYAIADQIRSVYRYVAAVRRAAVSDDEEAWDRLMEAARVESELLQVERELDEAL